MWSENFSGKKPRSLFYFLGGLQLFVALGAIPVGYAMLTDPSGESTKLSVDILRGTPFRDFFIPGLVLFAVNGIGSFIGAWFSLGRSKFAGSLGMLSGLLLIGWLLFQIYWIGLYPVQQLTFLGVGMSEVYLGYRLSKPSKHRQLKMPL